MTVPEAWPERVRLSPGAAGAIVLMGDEPTSGPAKPAGGPAADPADEAPRFRIVLTPLATSRTTAEIEMAVRREFGMIPAAAQAGVTYIKVNQGRARGLLISATDPTGTLGTDEDPFRGGGCVRMAKGVVRFDGQEWGVAVLARSDDPAVMAAANKVLGSLRAVKW